jgi:CHASE3 domain sensor protein
MRAKWADTQTKWSDTIDERDRLLAGDERAVEELAEAQQRIAELTDELADAIRRPPVDPNSTETVTLRSELTAARQTAATLRAELDKLRDHIESRPSGVEHEIVQVPIITRRQEALEESLKQFAEDNPTSSAVQSSRDLAP